MAGAATLAHLDKHRCALGGAHGQVDFAPAAPGRPIIAFQKTQTVPLQVLQYRTKQPRPPACLVLAIPQLL